MVVVEKKELTDKEYFKLIEQALDEKEMNNIVKTRCPMCDDIIDVELRGNSAITKCTCGYMLMY